MAKIKIKLAALGQLPIEFNINELPKWNSSIFQVTPNIETYILNEDSEGEDWEYTDDQLEKFLRTPFNEDFLIIFLNVKLQHNWYVRRLTKNRVLFSFYEIGDILRAFNIPLRNISLRVLYAASIVYRRYGNRVPNASEETDYAHDETRGCIFDMNASKWDVVHSCHIPIICEFCISKLKNSQVSNELINSVNKEIRKIKKPLFYRLLDFVKSHPLWSITLSIISALIIGITSSILAIIIFESLKNST